MYLPLSWKYLFSGTSMHALKCRFSFIEVPRCVIPILPEKSALSKDSKGMSPMTNQESQEIYGQLLGIAVSTSSSHHQAVSCLSAPHAVSKPPKISLSECISKQQRGQSKHKTWTMSAGHDHDPLFEKTLLQDNHLVWPFWPR